MSKYTRKQIDAMASAEYAQHMNEPEFQEVVNGIKQLDYHLIAPKDGASNSRDRAQLDARREADPSFDPAFDEEPTVVTPSAVIPVPEVAVIPAAPAVPAVAAELPEWTVSYQPVDKSNRPVGGKQVIKYRAAQEISVEHPLVQQLIKNHIEATVAIREARAKMLVNSTEVPEGASSFPTWTEFGVLSAEEREVLNADLQDPAKADAASSRLAESARNEALNGLQQQNFELRAKEALNEFKAGNPDFYRCAENAQALIGYVTNRNLDPTDKNNLQKAYDALQAVGGLISRPVPNQSAAPALVTATPNVREEKTAVNTQPPVEATARISPEVPPQATRPAALSTGLSNADAFGETEPIVEHKHWYVTVLPVKDGKGNVVGNKTYYDLEAIDALDGATQKNILNDRTPKGRQLFAKIEEAEQERAQRLADARRKRGW